jgi:ABC-type multidrug transport system fused ATPase/permease subunit
MHLEAGERVALKGPAGSGKTTLVDLLCALRDPQTGRVEIDGEDTREICLETLRERIVCIREAEVFSGSIRENLRVARSDASDGEIDDVLRAIGLLDELRALPDGLATRVSTDGLPMTRSQVARLMFARALLSRPSILMVDGELAMVEGPERVELLDALFDPERPLTLLVVSSCDDVVARCDRSVFLTAAGTPRVEASGDEAVRAESVDV